MLSVAAFPLFLVLSAMLIYAIIRNKKISLTASETAVIFGFKVAMGCLYGFIFQQFYRGDDTWLLHQGSVEEYRKLMTDPVQFIADLNPVRSFQQTETFTGGVLHLVSDLEYWIITKPLAVFNMFSMGNYYINVVFFNLLTFWGQYLLFKLFAAQFPDRRRLLLLIIFFLPSGAFWLSGIRADAWIMLSLAVTLFYFYSWLQTRKVIDGLLVIAGLTGVLIFRLPLLMLVLPGLLAWFLSRWSNMAAWKVFAIVYGLGVVLFFASAYVSADLNLLTFVVKRQHEFLALKGNTEFALNRLTPEPDSFFSTLPQAFANTFLRPYPWEARGILQWLASGEIMLFWILLIMSVVGKAGTAYGRQPLIWLAIFFGVGLYLFIGYTIPFPGAIVRYKVIAEVLLFIAICLRFRSNNEFY